LLFDEELPVRYAAANSIKSLLTLSHILEFLKPALKNLLEIFLKLMSQIESEELVGALEEIVK